MTAPILNSPPRGTDIFSLNISSKSPTSQEGINIFGEDGFTFGDLLDIVNPLQHIPIVGTIYRKITGDTIAPAMEIAGGALFGGPLGAILSVVKTAIQSQFKNNGADPSSPYMDKESTTINPATIANNTSQQFPKTISNNDYSPTTDSSIKQTDSINQPLEKPGGWIVNTGYINKESYSQNTNKEITIDNTKELYASINTLQGKPVDRPGGWIVNAAYKGTETYTNVVTSTNTPANSIDVIIGSRFGAS